VGKRQRNWEKAKNQEMKSEVTPGDYWPLRTLTPNWVVLYLALYWLQVYLLRHSGIPNRPLIFDTLFLLATAVVLWRNGGGREVRAYLIGRFLPPRDALPASVLLLALMMGTFYAFGWGQPGTIERPNLILFLLAPVTEEMVFRGVILAALLGYATAPRWATILLSALVFASCHGVDDTWRLLRLVVMGCFYGYAYVLTRSVLFCVLCHALWNMMCSCPVMQHGTWGEWGEFHPAQQSAT
jgi:membrane protease YdiL (CAAX protease family)